MSGRERRFPGMPALAAGLTLLLGACSVGPAYRGPPDVAHEARFVRGDAADPAVRPASSWWRSLADPELEHLIDTALAKSPDIEAGVARLRKARTQVREQGATEYPKISADASAIRSNAALGPSTNGLDFYFLGFDASWELDFFGKVQSARAAAMAQADVSRSDLANVEVSLAAEIGRTYIELREHQAELQLLHRSADIEQRMLDLTQQRRARGVSSDLEVERFRTLVENTRAMTIPAEENIEASMDLLAVLTGSAPGSLDGELAEPKPLPDLPADVAIGDPAEMLRRRPDIRSAERQIAARAAILKVRTADLFPQVSLLGTLGYGSDSISGLFHNASFIYFAAPSLRWSFLDFGANRARVREASADVDEALALYRKAILEALQDAESSLSRYGHARRSVASLEQVKESADRAAELASQLQTAGALSVIDQLDTERTRLSAEEDLLRSKAALAEGFISLQKSLGLGWERGG